MLDTSKPLHARRMHDMLAFHHDRGQAADVVLDHPSLSRMHTAIMYHSGLGTWAAADLGSVHGTRLDGRTLKQALVLMIFDLY